MTVEGLAAKKIKDEFYKSLTKQYNTTNEVISVILTKNGVDKFDTADVDKYSKIVHTYFFKKNKEVKPAREHSNNNPVQVFSGHGKTSSCGPTPLERMNNEKYPCPILGCNGYKIFSTTFHDGWSCSTGGHKHRVANTLAHLWKNLHPDSPTTAEERALQFLNDTKEEDIEERSGEVVEAV